MCGLYWVGTDVLDLYGGLEYEWLYCGLGLDGEVYVAEMSDSGGGESGDECGGERGGGGGGGGGRWLLLVLARRMVNSFKL